MAGTNQPQNIGVAAGVATIKETQNIGVAAALTTPVPTALKVMAHSDIWSVYLFLIPVVLLFLSDCLLNYDTLSVFVIMILRVSVLL